MPYTPRIPRSRRGRFWIGLGSPNAVRLIFGLVLVYALVIGGLIVGYARVQQCLQDYSDDAANSTAIRTLAAADDRALNQREALAALRERSAIRANTDAVVTLLERVATDGEQPNEQALLDFRAVNKRSQIVFNETESERAAIAQERIAVDKRRSAAPPPPPPSETC